MRLLSVFMSRTKSGSKSSSEVRFAFHLNLCVFHSITFIINIFGGVVGDWAEKWRVTGSSPSYEQKVEDVVVASEVLEHCLCTLEQSTNTLNAQIGPCNELATYPGVYPALTHIYATGIDSSTLPANPQEK